MLLTLVPANRQRTDHVHPVEEAGQNDRQRLAVPEAHSFGRGRGGPSQRWF